MPALKQSVLLLILTSAAPKKAATVKENPTTPRAWRASSFSGFSPGDSADDCAEAWPLSLLQLRHNAARLQRHGSTIPRRIMFVEDKEVDDDSADDHVLILNHNPKCGGTFVRSILSESVANVDIETENDVLEMSDADSPEFVMGMARDPFSYYVSLWSFNSCGGGAFTGALSEAEKAETYAQAAHCEGVLGSSADDQVRFRRWLKLVNHPAVGLASMRFYFKYVANSETEIPWIYETARRCVNDEGKCVGSKANATTIAQGFSQFGHRKDKICWVETKQLVSSTKACLLRFEEAGGHVDWAAFDKAVEKDRHNASPHDKISSFYDEESIQSVLNYDRFLFNHFNFSRSPQDWDGI